MSVTQEQRPLIGALVRVLDVHGRATNFVGRVMLVRRGPFGPICDVAGNQRRVSVPPHQLAYEDGPEPPLVNVHRSKPAKDIGGRGGGL